MRLFRLPRFALTENGRHFWARRYIFFHHKQAIWNFFVFWEHSCLNTKLYFVKLYLDNYRNPAINYAATIQESSFWGPDYYIKKAWKMCSSFKTLWVVGCYMRFLKWFKHSKFTKFIEKPKSTHIHLILQLLTSDYIRLVNKPYDNEVTLGWQNPPLNCC